MKKYILLKNARIADTERSCFYDSDILIRQKSETSPSEIVSIGNDLSLPSGHNVMLQTVNLHSQMVCPSFVDMRCDICEPGSRNRESFETLGASASFGGFGAVVSVPITGLSADDATVIAYISENEHRTNGVKILPCAPLTHRSSANEISDFDSLVKNGAVAFADDGTADPSAMMQAMRICAEKDLLVITHCEEKSLTGNGVMNSGEVSKMLGLVGIPNAAEEIALARNILLAAETGCRLHVSHISTARSAQMIRAAKKSGIRVTCDTAPQYFALSDRDVLFYSENAKVMPPLRTGNDRQAIIEAIKDGTIDCICSDHSPKTDWEKPHDFTKALPGITGLQTAFTLALDRLVMNGQIDIFRLISLFSVSPASIIGHGYEIKEGAPAYLNVFSLDYDTFFQTGNVKSKSKNSPFLEASFSGCLTYSMIDGVLNINPDICTF